MAVSEEAPLQRSVVRASRKRMDTSIVCRGVLERARAGDNRYLGTNPHFSTVVKGDVKVPGEVPAKNGFRAKDTDDCRILSTISKPGNF
jgi:hypothetical protein